MITQMNHPPGHGLGGRLPSRRPRSYLMVFLEHIPCGWGGASLRSALASESGRMRSLVTSMKSGASLQGFSCAIVEAIDERRSTSRFPGAERCQYDPPDFPQDKILGHKCLLGILIRPSMKYARRESLLLTNRSFPRISQVGPIWAMKAKFSIVISMLSAISSPLAYGRTS